MIQFKVEIQLLLEYPLYLVDVVLLLLGEAENVVGLVGELHVLLVVNAVHSHLTLKKYFLKTDKV